MSSSNLLSALSTALQAKGEHVPKEKILAILQNKALEECAKELPSLSEHQVRMGQGIITVNF